MRSVLIYLSILAAALAGGVYFAGALIDPAVYALAALPSAPSAEVPARFAKSPPPAPEPTPPAPAAVERTVVVAPPALERPVESERTRALRKANEVTTQSVKRKPRRANSAVAGSPSAGSPSQDPMSFAPSRTFGPFRSTSDSW